MSNPLTPPHGAAALRRGSWYDPNVRVGDAERSQVADRLAQHYSYGRLDQVEFGSRLDQAMTAKTVGELRALLADLPEIEPFPSPPAVTGGRRQQRRMLRLQLERERELLRHERREHRQAAREQRWHSLRWLPLLAAFVLTAAMLEYMLRLTGIALLLILIVALWLHHNRGGYRGPDRR